MPSHLAIQPEQRSVATGAVTAIIVSWMDQDRPYTRMIYPPQSHESSTLDASNAAWADASYLMVLWKGGAACVTRTRDPLITNEVLYRLS